MICNIYNSEFDGSFSLTPNFSWVFGKHRSQPFQRFCRLRGFVKLLKQFGDPRPTDTPLKRGVNERTTNHIKPQLDSDEFGGTTDSMLRSTRNQKPETRN